MGRVTKRHWFRNGCNPNAVITVLVSGLPAIAVVLIGGVAWANSSNVILAHAGDFSWLIGCGLDFLAFTQLEKPQAVGRATGMAGQRRGVSQGEAVLRSARPWSAGVTDCG